MQFSDHLRELELFDEICRREHQEIELCDARPSALGGSFKKMNMTQIEYYLNFCENTKKRKHELRKLVGWWKYYFVYTFKFINNYNAYYYNR